MSKLIDFGANNGLKVVTEVGGPSLTRQEFAEECDINALMARYEGHAIGGPGNLAPQNPVYVDFEGMPDNLMEYMEMMEKAKEAFMTLPAKVRGTFDNDAYAFVDFASQTENLNQMREWGLAPPAPPAPGVPVGKVEDLPSPPPAPDPK